MEARTKTRSGKQEYTEKGGDEKLIFPSMYYKRLQVKQIRYEEQQKSGWYQQNGKGELDMEKKRAKKKIEQDENRNRTHKSFN